MSTNNTPAPAPATTTTTVITTTTSPAPLTPDFSRTSLQVDQSRDYYGTVQFFNEYKEYGFITPDDGQGLPLTWNGGVNAGSNFDPETANNNVFFHVSSICRIGRRYLEKGDRVQFYLRLDNNRVKAEEIYLTVKDKKGNEVIDETRARYPNEYIQPIRRTTQNTAWFIKIIDKGISLEETGEDTNGNVHYKEVTDNYFSDAAIAGAFSGVHDEHDVDGFLPFTIVDIMPGVEIEVVAHGKWGELGYHIVKDKHQNEERKQKVFPMNEVRKELAASTLKKRNELPAYMLRKKSVKLETDVQPVETATTFEEAMQDVRPLRKEELVPLTLIQQKPPINHPVTEMSEEKKWVVKTNKIAQEYNRQVPNVELPEEAVADAKPLAKEDDLPF
jgi:cold shock CspA family protein